MYKYELVTLLEKVLMKSYQMKNGEHAFHCPFCNHHKKKLQVNCETGETPKFFLHNTENNNEMQIPNIGRKPFIYNGNYTIP